MEASMPGTEWSLYENGMPGVHLIINPQKKPPVEARINAQFVNHSLRLSADELKTILASRDKGVATLNSMMGDLLPGFAPDVRKRFSAQIADALLEKSLNAQLSLEAPNTFDRLQKRDEMLQSVLDRAGPPGAKRAPPPSLIEQIPVGVSVTVHFW
jgi:hypothetical protein